MAAKKKPRRRFSDDQKRAIVAELAEKKVGVVVAEHGLTHGLLSTWRKKFAGKAQQGKPARDADPEPKAKLQIIGLTPLIKEIVAIEVKRELPAAVKAAMGAVLRQGMS